MKKKNKTFKNGLAGKLDDDRPFAIYCNEKDEKRGPFLFKCCKGCRHDKTCSN